MILRIVQIPVNLVLIVCALAAATAILALFIAGTLVGSIKELFRFHLVMPGTKLGDYEMEGLKGEVREYFNLRSSGSVRGNRVIYLRGK